MRVNYLSITFDLFKGRPKHGKNELSTIKSEDITSN